MSLRLADGFSQPSRISGTSVQVNSVAVCAEGSGETSGVLLAWFATIQSNHS